MWFNGGWRQVGTTSKPVICDVGVEHPCDAPGDGIPCTSSLGTRVFCDFLVSVWRRGTLVSRIRAGRRGAVRSTRVPLLHRRIPRAAPDLGQPLKVERSPYAQTTERAPISCLFLGNRRLGEGRTISLPRSTPGLRRSRQRRRYRAPHGRRTSVPSPENLAAKGVRERKRSVPRLSRVPNPAKRLKVVQRSETVYRLLTPRRD